MKTEIKRIGKLLSKEDVEESLRNREIPVKYCYLDNGANAWHKLRRDNEYRLGEKENLLLKRSLREVKRIIGNSQINLIHLGVGDGIEIPIFFDNFSMSGVGRYVGVDISEQMIWNSIMLNENILLNINPLWYCSDIEVDNNLELVCEDVKSIGAKRSILFLTNEGSLLSNRNILKLLRDSLGPQDYLFITLEGDNLNDRDGILKTYSLPRTLELLSIGLQKIGYNSKKGKFFTLFNESELRVEVYFKSENEEPVLCLASYKPREDEFKERLRKAGLDIQYFEFYEDIHAFAVLCKRDER